MRLRTHLSLLVLVCLVPVLLLASGLIVWNARLQRVALERELRGTARALSLAVDRELERSIAILTTLAASPALARDDYREVYDQAERVAQAQGGWVVLFDRTGQQLFNTLRPFGTPLPRAPNLDFVEHVIGRRAPLIDNLFLGRVSQRYAVPVDVPVIRNGEVSAVLNLSSGAERFARLLEAQRFPADWTGLIVDRQHSIVAESGVADSPRVGQRAPDWYVAGTSGGEGGGQLRGPSPEGAEVYSAFERSGLSGWTIAVAVPAALVESAFRRSLAVVLAGASGAIALALILAVLVGRRLAEPVRDLAARAAALGRGESLPVAPASAVSEVETVRRALEAARATVQERVAAREQLVREQTRRAEAETAMIALREADVALRRRTAELETMLDIIPVGLGIAHDAAGDRISLNSSFERLLRLRPGQNASVTGPGKEELPYRCVRDGRLIPGEEMPMRVACRTGMEVRDVQYDVVRASGEVLHLMVSAAPLFDEHGQVRGAIAAHVDVTRLKRAEAALRAASQAKDEFLAMLGHELRNPLGAIAGAVTVLNVAGAVADTAERARAVIGRQVQHLSRLVDDLLDVSRVTSGKVVLVRRPVDMGELVRRAVEAWRAAGRLNGHDVSVDVSSVWVDGDETRIEQVVLNLVANALKYTPAGGQVRVRAGAERATAVLEVADTGAGIPPGLGDRIFDVFVQGERTLDRAQGGLGIGLTLVKALVEMHGGTVQVRSDGVGKGAVFTVRLPRVSAATEPGPLAAARSPAEHVPRRIVIIEDNQDAREMLGVRLRLDGHEVHEAADGRTGVAVAARVMPDVALIDIGLPGLDGYEVARQLRAGKGGTAMVLIAVTGYGQAEDRQRATEAGFDAHVVKPVPPQRLAELIAGGRPTP